MWPLLDAALHPSGRSVRLDMPIAMSHRLPNLGAYARDLYRLHFTHELAAGTVKPLIVPYSLLGTVILPVLYFSIPHTSRPWLYRARYLLWAFILAFNLHEAVTSSSANFAIGYAVGLMQAWGILWTATLLIWMSPQFEAERVERRKRTTTTSPEPGVDGTTASGLVLDGNAKGMKENVHHLQANGRSRDPTETRQHQTGPKTGRAVVEAPDESIARSLEQGYEYYWQAYPAAAPFLTRLSWSYDLVTSFRGTGWNWTVPILPHFSKPEKPQSSSPVDLDSIPLCTRQGYRRFTTRGALARAKLLPLVLGYLALDVGSVLMMKDPHFILGPEFATATSTTTTTTPLPLPPFLAALPPTLLFTYRAMLCFSAIIIAIELIMTLWQLTCLYLLPGSLLGGATRAELWHYPSTYGAFAPNVLDKGLAGFWGGWWHQTFRVAFSAPTAWLARRGHIGGDPARSPRARAVAGLLAFAQSAFLHSLGSVSCLPPSRPWSPPVFFILAWVGVLVQTGLCAAARPVTRGLPRVVRRGGNLVFVFVWLCATQYWFCDDMARAGIWLLEPVPVSLLRAAGLGRPGDSWWRWDWVMWPRWYVGRHWWDSGIAL
ncbi:hypothetical protein VMCG_00929 [Cytospora schulzeri]|uniref:Wax synthase domain-containing protein n=1 Tax=Cytospora schulzeri TaxID=448051 RepID=A0A423X6K1_9PEZI|nr:hypothetical protein VMCG_00929 [Valsa malicola]